MIATFDGEKWRVRTFDGKIVEPAFFEQAVERASPLSLEEDPILILRALSLKARGFRLSETLEKELKIDCRKVHLKKRELSKETKAQLATYFGKHVHIAQLPEYKEMNIKGIFTKPSLTLPFAASVSWGDLALDEAPAAS